MYRKLTVVVYEGERVLGEAELQLPHPQNGVVLGEEIREIRIWHYSPPSERCPPLAVLHTVNAAGICFKLESPARNQDSQLSQLHASCLRDNKAALTSVGGKEIHLVAMHSRKYEERGPCFWGFSVASSLYNSCLVMLNLRCLGIVFDLDETLIVANTMPSFEDKIDALQRKINSESDPHRVSGLWAEVKRYQDDKNMLKHYIETDQVIDNEKIIKSQSEVVPALSESHPSIVRPIIRLQDKNIILTRINPLIRDTSVLVRLRPAWEDLRSYLIARGRKRFEVFVCTMAERDYALEMWRLLDPESHLINLRELLDRVVCVKSGSRKSLFNVFQIGNCHPKMALVIDDRLKVWDETDQPRVHVVPAFAPYHAPQAEANSSVPVLCVARNVACNVRGGFFKEFDDGLLQHIAEVAYEDDIKDVPSLPDVSQYMVSDGDPSASNGKKDSLGFDGMADAEVERKLKEAILSSSTSLPILNLDPRISSVLQYMIPSSSFTINPPTVQGPTAFSANSQLLPSTSANLQLTPATSSANLQLPQATFSASSQLPHVSAPTKPVVAQVGQVETTSHISPGREEGEVPESELDPDTRRRLLILQHGQDMREPNNPPSETQPPSQLPLQVSEPKNQPQGWFPVEEEAGTRQLNRVPQSKEFPLPADSVPNDKIRIHRPPFFHRKDSSIPPRRVHEGQRSLKEVVPRGEHSRLNQPSSSLHYFSANKYPGIEAGQVDPYTETCTEALHDIAFKCGTKVEFKQTLVSSSKLQFFAEVLFAGERIGEAYGRTRREAQSQAAEGSLLYLSGKYLSQLRPNSSFNPGDGSRLVSPKNNGFITDANSFGYQSSLGEEGIPLSTSASQPKILDPRIDASKKHVSPVSGLRELCTTEGLSVVFQSQSQFSGNPGQRNEACVQVEINGEVLGKGIGLPWDEAKSQAAEKAIGAVKSKLGQFSHRHHGSPRSVQGIPNKKAKQDLSRGPPLQRIPSSHRYQRDGSPVP